MPQLNPLARLTGLVSRKWRGLVLRAKRAWNAGTIRRLRTRLAEEPAPTFTPPPAPSPKPDASSSAAPQRDFEDVLMHIYLDLVRPGDFAIDIGANVGRHMLGLSGRVYPAGCVIAFEPLPVGRAAIEAMYQKPEFRPLRECVVLSPLALGTKPGTAEFVFAVDVPGWSGLKERVYDGPTRLEKIPVRVETLDGLLGDLRRCRFIKIDAEGGEYDALRGGERLIRRTRPVVAFEFGANSCTGYGVKPIDMGRFWEGLNYRLVDINGCALTTAEFARSAEVQEVWDYIAVPAEMPEVLARVREICGKS